MPSYVRECGCASHNMDRVDIGLTWSNSRSLGTLKAFYHPGADPGYVKRGGDPKGGAGWQI